MSESKYDNYEGISCAAHTGPENALIQDDYPYGRLRCKRHIWLEYVPGKGYRFVAVTQNPKTFVWNKPHKSTYSQLGILIKILTGDEAGHIRWVGLHGGEGAAEIQEFITKFGNLFSEQEVKIAAMLFNGAERHRKLWALNAVVEYFHKPNEFVVDNAFQYLQRAVKDDERLLVLLEKWLNSSYGDRKFMLEHYKSLADFITTTLFPKPESK